MKLIGISQVRNEGDVIETFVRYHLQCLDELVLVDHQSADSTLQVLEQLKAEGLPLQIRHLRSTSYDQDESLTQVMRDCAQNRSADWIIPLDADEFLRAVGGRTIRSVLASAPANTVLQVAWQSYLPPTEPAHTSRANVLENSETRLAEEHNLVHKVLVPSSVALRRGTTLRMGSHRLVRLGLWKRKKIPAESTSELRLAHFPVRSAAQIRKKILVGWLATLAKRNRRRSESPHWKELYGRLSRTDQSLGPAELRRIAISYTSPHDDIGDTEPATVQDPVRPEGDWPLELRYTKDSTDLLQVILRQAEDLAQSVGSLKKYRR